ncbi:MAG: SDR family oxidoreductase [Verrucomicrobia bacterium]|nr:SDR family oxidoreductase [Verrucomicrobiota bacterium]MDA1068038.1 SDR family oxidoreductase [Verrucomicrobiota bacterium]
MHSLKNKVAVITGASSGIGAAIAKVFAAEGVQVVLAARSKEKIENLASEINESGGIAKAVETDVTDEAAVINLFESVGKYFDSLDILINNAGIGMGGPIEELTFETWRKVLSVNLDGAFLCAREAFRIMKPQGRGRIINIGSVSAKMPRVHSAPYTTSKFALEGLTRSLALDGRAYGISVGVLQPGNTKTAIWEGREEAAAAEGVMNAYDLARVALAMITLPDGVSVLESTVLPISMPFLGRG